MRALICSKQPGVGHWVALLVSQLSPGHTVEVLSDLDEVVVRVTEVDFDVCFIGPNSFSWFSQLSSHLNTGANPNIKCVVGVSRVTSEVILQALKFKAHAIIDLGNSIQDIVEQLDAVVAGDVDLTRDNNLEDIHRLCGEETFLRFCRDDLDLRILAELMNGASNEAIAATCNVAIQTVRNRLVRLMRDVGVENRTQLATRLVRE
jgi:DNA-binding NarL/FixJ family response regulator